MHIPVVKKDGYTGDLRRYRERMVNEQLKERGVTNTHVLSAMSKVHRHRFVPEALQARAYGDHPLPIGFGQTISQPYIVACMSMLLDPQPGLSVLEVGTGSGYQTAVLSEMGLDVFSVERVKELYFQTKDLLHSLGYRKIRTKLSDGTLGWQENAPFDRIIVTAGGPSVPSPLIEQLGDPGIMVIPIGSEQKTQEMIRIVKNNGVIKWSSFGDVAFVNLVGEYGW